MEGPVDGRRSTLRRSPRPLRSRRAPEAPPAEGGALKALVDDLHERREKAKLGGGEEKIAKQHAAGKLTARERIDLLVDEGTFVEMGLHARPHFSQRAMEGKEAPADGVITGWGDVDGRPCAIAAYDFTVMAGSMGMTGEIKMARLRELALQKRMPLIWLLDSAGARIQEAAGSLFAGSGHLFREEVEMSGVVPLVAAMLGPCAAGTAYIPGLSDFVPMVVGQGAMALAGPHLTKAVTGEDISMEDLGGAKVHCRKSGVGDLECKDDAECIEAVKTYLSFFPSNCEQKPPVRETEDPADRMSEKLLEIVPESNRKPYDMYEVIARDRRRRRVLRHQAEVREDDHHLPRAVRRPAGRDRRQPAEAARRHPRERLSRQGGAVRQPLRRLRDPARLPPGRSRVHGRLEGRARRDHPPRGEDALRDLARDGAEGHRRHPQGLRRRLLRDERPRLRARPDLRLAVGRDLGDGRRGRGQHHRPLGDRGLRRSGGDHARRCSTRSASRSTSTSPPATR